METIYKAFDGTEFVDPDDCFEYEMTKESEKLSVQLFDIGMKIHPIKHFMFEGFDCCYAVKFPTKECKQKFAEWFKETTESFGGHNDHFLYEDSDALYYIYDIDSESWVDAEMKYAELTNKAKEFALRYDL